MDGYFASLVRVVGGLLGVVLGMCVLGGCFLFVFWFGFWFRCVDLVVVMLVWVFICEFSGFWWVYYGVSFVAC